MINMSYGEQLKEKNKLRARLDRDIQIWLDKNNKIELVPTKTVTVADVKKGKSWSVKSNQEAYLAMHQPKGKK